MKLLALLVVLLAIVGLSLAFKYDFERDLSESDNEFVEKKEAHEFLKRLLHPFSSKNEEIKRETREVYEEKCEHVIPTKR
jgi:hypothetical protein